MPRSIPPIHRLNFGLADAAREADRYPELLLEGFYDPDGLAQEVLNGDSWLVLGPKGSGKSAIVEHLRLAQQPNAQVIIRPYDLYEFPYKDFLQLDSVGGDTTNLPAAWRWVLLLALIDSFNRDTSNASSRSDADFQRAVATLEGAGFLGGRQLRQIVMESNTRTLGTMLKPLTGQWGRSRQNRGLAIGAASQTLTELVHKFRSYGRHLIVLDGLDKQFVSGSVPWGELAALIQSVDALNAELHRAGTPAKIVVLVRPDMYDRLPSAETPKIRRDSGRLIEWYPSSEQLEASPLFELINKKASVLAGTAIDVVADYLPAEIVPRGRRGGRGIAVERYLLERTLHTPRDLGQLFESIKRYARANSEHGRVSEASVIDAANHYAFDYFYGDVRATVIGLVSQPTTERVLSLLKVVHGDKFSRRELLDAARTRDITLTPEELDEALYQLYQAGAVANIDRRGRVNFLFMQSTGELDVHGLMTMQRTFARGLNRAPLWSQGEQPDDGPVEAPAAAPATRARKGTRRRVERVESSDDTPSREPARAPAASAARKPPRKAITEVPPGESRKGAGDAEDNAADRTPATKSPRPRKQRSGPTGSQG